MKRENEGPRKWHLRNSKALETFQLKGPPGNVYTYIKSFLIEEGEDLFQISLKSSPIDGCYLISSADGVRASELSVVYMVWVGRMRLRSMI